MSRNPLPHQQWISLQWRGTHKWQQMLTIKCLLLSQNFGLCCGEARSARPASDIKIEGSACQRSAPVMGTRKLGDIAKVGGVCVELTCCKG
eukprot:14795450-Ditylum_brightwellii.AAC.1